MQSYSVMPAKRKFEDVNMHSQKIYDWKRRNVDSVRQFPKNCGTNSTSSSSSDIKCPKVDGKHNSSDCYSAVQAHSSHSSIKIRKAEVIRDFPEKLAALTSQINRSATEGLTAAETAGLPPDSDVTTYITAIRATSLRIIAPSSPKCDRKKVFPSSSTDIDMAEQIGLGYVIDVVSPDASLEDDEMENLLSPTATFVSPSNLQREESALTDKHFSCDTNVIILPAAETKPLLETVKFLENNLVNKVEEKLFTESNLDKNGSRESDGLQKPSEFVACNEQPPVIALEKSSGQETNEVFEENISVLPPSPKPMDTMAGTSKEMTTGEHEMYDRQNVRSQGVEIGDLDKNVYTDDMKIIHFVQKPSEFVACNEHPPVIALEKSSGQETNEVFEENISVSPPSPKLVDTVAGTSKEMTTGEHGTYDRQNVISQGVELGDLDKNVYTDDMKMIPYQGTKGAFDKESAGTNYVQESELDCSNKCKSTSREKQDHSRMSRRRTPSGRVLVSSAFMSPSNGAVMERAAEDIEVSIIPHDQDQEIKGRNNVEEILKLFDKRYNMMLMEDSKNMPGKAINAGNLLVKVAKCLKEEGKWIYNVHDFGNVPGIKIGDQFRFRAELAVVGLHREYTSGIAYVELNGKKFATSIVNSGRYKNKEKSLDVLIYSGQGGNSEAGCASKDQKPERGNLALMNSMDEGFPVRCIRKTKCSKTSNISSTSRRGSPSYVYDGLYVIKKCWQERNQRGASEFYYELHRISGQPKLSHALTSLPGKPTLQKECCVLDDISEGKEKKAIRVMNGIDAKRPPSFTYITTMVHSCSYRYAEPNSCDCVVGCSDSKQCRCVSKNGGEIPFNEKGEIVRAKPMVYECGPSCKCPPSCMNRVSQHGPSHQLEVFKTKSTGWGVRSRSYISSGSFICEYIGELIRENDAEQRVGSDDYLFEISDGGYTIDAAKMGNVGRFINHSCSPNLYAQKFLFDHSNKRMAHVAFFASENIPPLRELSYDYNYKVDRVRNVDGTIRKRDCYCGSRECTGRMY